MTIMRMCVATVAIVATLLGANANGQAIPELAQRSLGKLVAVWEIEANVDGNVSKDKIDAKWNQDRTAVVYYWQGTDPLTRKPVTSTGVIGWDGERNVLTEFAVASNGEIFSSSFNVSDEHWRCPTTGTLLIDGEYKSLKSLRIFEWKSPDEFVIVTRERAIDGEKAPNTIATLRAVR